MTAFTEKIRTAFVDSACAEADRIRNLRQTTRGALRTSDRERLGDLLELEDELLVAEVHGTGFGTVWQVVNRGHAHHESFLTKGAAVLAALGRRHGADDHAWGFAALILRVPTGTEEPAP